MVSVRPLGVPRPFLRHLRLALLPAAFFVGKTVLDVGCNEGWVTREIAHACGARRVVGVDIDDALVRAAWIRRRTLWSLQSPPHEHPAEHHDAFPHNVTFRTSDWVTEDAAADEPTYDVVIAPSTTKWIHLNHPGEGLVTFFRRAHRMLKPGGAFVVEPQAWETYGKACRMDPRLRENARHLRLHPQAFSALLEELGFGPSQHLGFHRPVDLYVKK
ncbi:Bicoid-interacting protein 3-domain-containing protein [Boletus coccyginus]|nr:Bicoid-interacting protein 3-domain-containing protein [Boletus coccyginus]